MAVPDCSGSLQLLKTGMIIMRAWRIPRESILYTRSDNALSSTSWMASEQGAPVSVISIPIEGHGSSHHSHRDRTAVTLAGTGRHRDIGIVLPVGEIYSY